MAEADIQVVRKNGELMHASIGALAALGTAFAWTLDRLMLRLRGQANRRPRAQPPAIGHGLPFPRHLRPRRRGGGSRRSTRPLSTWLWLGVSGLVGFVLGDLLPFPGLHRYRLAALDACIRHGPGVHGAPGPRSFRRAPDSPRVGRNAPDARRHRLRRAQSATRGRPIPDRRPGGLPRRARGLVLGRRGPRSARRAASCWASSGAGPSRASERWTPSREPRCA